MRTMQDLALKARSRQRTIVFPEGDNPTIRAAARRLADEQLARPVLLVADPSAGGLSGLDLVHPASSPALTGYVQRYCAARNMPERAGRRLVAPPLGFASMMVATGDVDGMVAGIEHPTEEVLMLAELLVGLAPDARCISSFFVMEVPGFAGGEGGRIVFADPAVNPDPDPELLADIAVTTARSVADMLDWTPRVAMLSFSTHGSADHPLVDKVVEATRLARARAPELAIGGELQADAALVEAVAQKKVGEGSPVAGRANILVFPDLNSANIGSKLVQRLAGAASYGPVLQGLARPVSDLSRGATADDVVGAAVMVAARGPR